MTQLTEAQKGFAHDVLEGLKQTPKRLPSKYFYNAEGDLLFQQIMALDEYYLTRAEEDIIKRNKADILSAFLGEDSNFRLIELGAGDGTKTKVLLRHFVESQTDFVYSPIDISANVLKQLEGAIKVEIPEVRVEPIQGDYFQALAELKKSHLQKEVLLFLGSTIGNFNQEAGLSFLRNLSDNLSSGDLLFIGFDLMKNPRTILAAYDDQQGVTKNFNLNLLKRINDELGGDFQQESFMHYPTYDPLTGETRSYLVSKEDQNVHLEKLGETIQIKAWEAIHTEISQKYSYEMISEAAEQTGFKVKKQFTDKNGYFQDSLWEKL